MPAQRLNFYRLLELDPAVDDWLAIELQLGKMKEQWAKDRTQGNPKAKRRAETALPLLKELEETLKDPEKRRQEAREARQQLEEARARDFQELDEAITLLRGTGDCDAEQWRRLLQHFLGRLSEAQLRSRLESAGIRLAFEGERTEDRRPSAPSLDKALVAQIQKNLEHLGHGDLYEFLGLRPQSSPQALSDRAKALYGESLRRGRADGDSAALNELAGVCSKVFASDAEKAKYDRYRSEAAMEGLKPQLELAGADGVLERKEVEALLHLARQRGVERAVAEAFISDYEAKRKWRVQRMDPGQREPEPQLCGFCRALSPPEAARCKSCGEPLRLDCPRCGMSNPTADAACGRCGARTGDAPLVKELLREGEALALAGKVSEAVICFDQGLLYWPGWAPLVEARRRVVEANKAREAALAELEGLFGKRHLQAALGALGRLERSGGSQGLEPIRRRIEEGLTRARKAFEGAEELRRRGTDAEAVLDGYEEALALCADFLPAHQALQAFPPPAPQGLVVEPSGSGFRLRWQGPASKRRLAFRVLRKARATPLGPEDGESLGETAAQELQDPSAAAGVPWWYAVYGVRGDTPSRQAARSGPHLLLGEVGDLEAVAGDGQITLRWKRPAGCLRVEVRRGPRKIPSPTEGDLVPTSGDSALDTGLANGETFGYRVSAVYADPLRAGAELRSTGRHLLVRPVAPPPAVEDLRAEFREGVIELRWTPLSSAQVEVRRLKGSEALALGSAVSLSELGRLGEAVPGLGSGFARTPVGSRGKALFQPFSVREQTAVAGMAVEVLTLEPVRRLRARRTGAGLALSWDWPSGGTRVLIAWDAGSFPTDPDPSRPQSRFLSRAEYGQSGCWLLPGHLVTGRLYLSVFSAAEEEALFSPPARIVDSGGEIATVSYQVRTRKHLLTRKVLEAWVELSTSDGLSMLPAVALVGKTSDVPISAKDGEVLGEPGELALTSGQGRITIPEHFLASRYFLKLFFLDPGAAREIRLLPAPKARLQVA
ncbi:MAG: hypothetical protein KDD47_13600 [Acidobacteria bacterium]|nr:hypothetical protein [Acidobacteriota bacterium]